MPLTGWRQRASASKPVIDVALQVDDRLIVQLELVPLDRLAQIHLDLAPVVDLLVHRAVVEPVGAAGARLDGVEREVGRHQQIVGVVAVVRPDRDADADAGADPITVDLVGLADRLDEALGQRLERGARRRPTARRPRIRRRRAGPGRRLSCSDCFSRFADLLQQQVADPMAERVVDDLEAVEIEEQDGEIRRARRPSIGCRCRRLQLDRASRGRRAGSGRPVSGSSDASRATCASASQRLVMSVKVCTKLPSGRWPLRTSITLPFGILRSQIGELHRCGLCSAASAGVRVGRCRSVGRIAPIWAWILDQLVEARRMLDEFGGQIEQLAAPCC